VTLTIDQADVDLNDGPLADAAPQRDARASRVWRAPRPVAPTIPGWARLAAAGAAVAVIAGGALGIARLDDGPTPASIPASPGSMYHVVDQIGARQLWQRGITGAGVNAAVDLTDERLDPSTAFVDTFGHGTHLAGIIAGRTPGADPAQSAETPDAFMGVAPDAGIVSVKVAGRDGVVTPEQMITGIDWVVAHADQLDIDVLTIAFDTGAAPSYVSDPLAAAIERAWQAGIVVVVAAGNDGAASNGLDSPATAPFAIAVGGVEATDDGFTVADWTSRGDGVRNPDLAAPGAHIASLRAPGSAADADHPEGYVDSQLFLGSGSSQSAAVTAGAAALLLSERPELTPDQVKQLLTSTASPVAGTAADRVGAGLVDLVAASAATPSSQTQTWSPTRVTLDVPRAAGLMTVPAWESSSWTSSSWTSSSWTSSSWTSSSWTSSSWTSSSWTSSSWTSSSWTSSSWTSSSWTSSSWTSSSWTSSSWT
jgi:serine protease AprX